MDSSKAYENNAREFLHGRDKSPIGSVVVREWANKLPKGSEVLEIACGGGLPITRELVEAGLQLWAIDSSETLISIFRSRFPDVPSKCERVQDSNYFGRKFDAVIAVGLIFLLPEEEQAGVFQRISSALNPEGQFLFTAPVETGTWQDMNTGLECCSIGYEMYREALALAGFRIVSTFEDIGKNNYYQAEKVI